MNDSILNLTEKIRPCDTENPYIFISYSSKDAEHVFKDVIKFQDLGYNVWVDIKNVDKTLPSWKQSAVEAVSDYYCSLLVFYVSKDSLTSQACYDEVMETLSERARNTHLEPVGLLCVDVDVINDITQTAQFLANEIRKSALPKAEKSSRTVTLSQFLNNVFNNNNERSRALSIDHAGRTVDYYSEITQSFPDDTRMAQPPAAQPDDKPETKPAEKPAVIPEAKPAAKPAAGPAVKPETKPAEKPAAGPAAKPETKPAEKPTAPAQNTVKTTEAKAPQSSASQPNTINYPNGSLYVGEIKNGKRHGKGKFTYPSGNTYEGQFKDDAFCGQGIYRRTDGSYYTGEFADNTYNGKGEYHFANGDVYKGFYKNGKRHGKGVFSYKSGGSLEAEYTDGVTNKGTRNYKDGSVYYGGWVNGKPSGDGEYKAVRKGVQAAVYIGSFKDGKYEGYGTYRTSSGVLYEGDFSNNLFHGQGTLRIPQGSIIDNHFYPMDLELKGEFVNGAIKTMKFTTEHP